MAWWDLGGGDHFLQVIIQSKLFCSKFGHFFNFKNQSLISFLLFDRHYAQSLKIWELTKIFKYCFKKKKKLFISVFNIFPPRSPNAAKVVQFYNFFLIKHYYCICPSYLVIDNSFIFMVVFHFNLYTCLSKCLM